jgi:hypothetical protein
LSPDILSILSIIFSSATLSYFLIFLFFFIIYVLVYSWFARTPIVNEKVGARGSGLRISATQTSSDVAEDIEKFNLGSADIILYKQEIGNTTGYDLITSRSDNPRTY